MDERRTLILARQDEYHHLEDLGDIMLDWLEGARIRSVDFTEDRSVLTGNLEEYSLLAFCMKPDTLSPAEETAIVSFVQRGGKFMGIHPAVVVDAENVRYIEMLGGRFDHHGEFHKFTINVADPGHPVVRGLRDFEVEEELYVLDRTPSNANVLLTADWEDRPQPMLYVRPYGQGEVMYNVMGHGPATYENPNFKKIIVQSVKWLLRK